MGGLSGIWLVCRWFGWFVGSFWVVWLVCEWFADGLARFVDGLDGFWVVSNFTANENKLVKK